ncbi:hypothetical protein DUNSADRAFT_4699 [Dunaliella salina]|uniref:G domain-containing protein n=1 Tax=Dunaliella salina TaxID=3046 RepID=A0ABQ7H7I5_DUNSA|nr:hypothetical protein DUNSADRAFT_4699 [Dunaliella salina]|eukprot:KAF5842815.1 hypothetical protein DUNSADRAFT_4699 [Dunaliella salina]
MAQEQCLRGLPYPCLALLKGRAASITATALGKAHMALMIVDARDGIAAPDEELAAWLQRTLPDPTQVVLVANKAEGAKARQNMEQTIADSWRLGFGELVALSASSGEGMTDLYAALQPMVDRWRQRLIADALLHTPTSLHESLASVPGDLRLSTGGPGASRPDESEEAEESIGGAVDGTPVWAAAAAEKAGRSTIRHVQSSSSSSAIGVHSSSSVSSSSSSSADEDAWENRQAFLGGGRHRPAVHDWQDEMEARGDGGDWRPGDLKLTTEGGVHEGAGVEEGRVLAQGEEQAHGERAIRMAIVGLPNVGKSTLLNTLLGEERVLTGPEPGLTRDVVHTALHHQGTKIELLDTAGYVGATKVFAYDDVGGEVADIAREAALSAMASAHVVVLVVDVAMALKSQKNSSAGVGVCAELVLVCIPSQGPSPYEQLSMAMSLCRTLVPLGRREVYWYKDARTLQALEGELQARKQRRSSSKASDRAVGRRPSLRKRLLKPRLYMAERASAAAAETQGLSTDAIYSSDAGIQGRHAAEVTQTRLLSEDEHYFGRGAFSASTSDLRSSRGGGSIRGKVAKTRSAASGPWTGSRRRRGLDAYMEHLTHSPSAPLCIKSKKHGIRGQG